MASQQRFMGLGKSPAYDSALAYFEEERYSDAIPLFEMALQECNEPTVQKLARAYLAESYAKLGYKRINQGDWARAYAYFTAATDYAPSTPTGGSKRATPRTSRGTSKTPSAPCSRRRR
jgi:tetratricopeptide (TPR) repeat protein